MTRNSRLNCLGATKNKRLLFKVAKTNWTHNDRPFLHKRAYGGRLGIQISFEFLDVKHFKQLNLG